MSAIISLTCSKIKEPNYVLVEEQIHFCVGVLNNYILTLPRSLEITSDNVHQLDLSPGSLV